MATRRSPTANHRKRDSERTRAALIEAATIEFADKGLAGARVGQIAARAGVNKQLISYYFGGKEGLHQAILQRWAHQEEQLNSPDISLTELAMRYLRVGHRQPHLQRLFLRECLGEDVSQLPHEPQAADLDPILASQRRGELASELDPAFVLLALQSIVVAGAQFPADVKRLTGLDPASAAYLTFAETQLRNLLHRLRPSAGGQDAL